VSEYPGRQLNLDVPKCNNLVISAIIDGASGIQEILHDDGVDAIYDLNGHRIDAMRKGINIVRDKKGRVRKVVLR
jgi:hypothetical protein